MQHTIFLYYDFASASLCDHHPGFERINAASALGTVTLNGSITDGLITRSYYDETQLIYSIEIRLFSNLEPHASLMLKEYSI